MLPFKGKCLHCQNLQIKHKTESLIDLGNPKGSPNKKILAIRKMNITEAIRTGLPYAGWEDDERLKRLFLKNDKDEVVCQFWEALAQLQRPNGYSLNPHYKSNGQLHPEWIKHLCQVLTDAGFDVHAETGFHVPLQRH